MRASSFLVRVLLGFLIFCAGAASMRIWDYYHLKAESVAVVEVTPLEALSVDLRKGEMPEGVVSPDEEAARLIPAKESQLAKIDLPDVQAIIPRSGNAYESDDEAKATAAAPVQITGDYPSINGNATPAQPDEPTSITMIDAPVESLLIKTAQEYKDFKRRARGSYPAADFNREQILVLESTSNLPDKVFEIQNVQEENGQWVVYYRVSVFGLDKKTNTHSAVVMKKKNLPIVLKQVL